MDLQTRKYQFIQELMKVDKASIMDKLESILKKERHPKRETLSEYNKEIDQAIEQIEKDEFYTQMQVRKKADEW